MAERTETTGSASALTEMPWNSSSEIIPIIHTTEISQIICRENEFYFSDVIIKIKRKESHKVRESCFFPSLVFVSLVC